tara:strand:+ start:3961 stop:6321 length:2361 start_codon:yes stop_codon:yes gene_type:complete
MTSSFQSTAFQSSASPVDTFVRPPSVQPKSDIEQLAEALKTLNPKIQSFLETRLEKAVEKEEAEGTELAIEDAAKNFKDISRGVKKADGEDAARQLIGGSIFADRAYQRTKTEILGSNLASTLSNSYATTQVDGKSLNAFSLQSPQFQTWLEGERTRVVDQLGDINPTYVNKYFLPKLADATATVTSSHIKQHQEYNLEKLKNLAVPLVKGLIAKDDDDDEDQILINTFEESMNNLGLVTKDRSDLNKTIVGVLLDQAEAVGLSGGGDIEGAEDILDIALQFPYGADGKLNLTAHPDYQNKVNDLKKSINNYIYEYENRKDVERKRIQREDTINQLKQFAETGNAQIISDLIKKYPLDATKISTSGVAIDGNTLERSALVEFGMINGNYESSKEASIAALQWYQDSRTPKTVQNRNRLTQLLGTAESVERGDYTEINKGLTELLGQLKGEFSSSDFIVGATGQLNDNGSRKVTDFYNKAKLELYQYRLSEEGKAANTLQIIEKIEAVKSKYIEQARKLNPSMSIQSGLDDEEEKKNREQNIDDMQGDASFVSEVSDEEARRIIEAEDAEESNNIFTVKRGDTLTSIATQTGVSIPNLIKLNNIKDPNKIQVGDNLILKETEAKTTETTTTPTITQSSKQQAIVTAATELGVKPEDLASVISQETMGTFNHQITGGEGGNYKGLIQFGIPERKKYGYREDMTFEEQMLGPVVRYLKDRGVKKGHGVKEIYAAILTGDVSTLQSDGLTRTDSFGTSVESALPELSQGGSHYKNALDFLAEQGKFQQKS